MRERNTFAEGITTLAEYAKPLPEADAESKPFWDGCKAHELRAQRCAHCGKFRWPPRPLCHHCRSTDSAWVRLEGTGTVYSYVVVHRVVDQTFAPDVPYVIVNMLLDGTDGQVRLLSNLTCHPVEQVTVGMPVRVFYDDVTQEVTLPKFVPAAQPQQEKPS